jgi:hypothetical protein
VLTVACVLRSGGEYTPAHVLALQGAVEKHLGPHRFVCLTDFYSDAFWGYVETIRLAHPWPGWWSKLGLLRPGLFTGRVLYLDLDTVIVGDLSDLAAYAGPFAMLTDFMRPVRPASGVMAWRADSEPSRAIWDAWVRDPAGHMAAHQGGGDQAFIRSVLGDGVDRLQDLYPGQCVSYKVHCKDGLPPGARVVSAHGRPKPWDAEWRL